MTGEKRRTFTVALTGGIASGKTTVSDLFRQLHVPVIDTDIIARNLVQRGRPLFKAVVETFGNEFVGKDGQIDRGKLRKLVFSNATAKERLESILHPACLCILGLVL